MRFGILVGVTAAGALSLGGCSTENVVELDPGTCFNVSFDATEVYRVPTVSCAEEHDAEVFSVLEITENITYDDETVFTLAYDLCTEAFEGYVGVDFFDEQVFDLDVYAMYPLQAGWDLGDRGVVCSIVSIDPNQPKLTGSQRNAFTPN